MQLKQHILQLRAEGFSYSDIQRITGASKSSISYHLGSGQKEKSRLRNLRVKRANPLINKVDKFKRVIKQGKPNKPPSLRANSTSFPKRLISIKLRTYFMTYEDVKNKNRVKVKDFSFNAEYVLENKEPVCYLTGRKVDFSKTYSYELDHIICRAKGGDCSFENLGIACSEANRAKSDLSIEEFFQLCIDVVKHNNLKID